MDSVFAFFIDITIAVLLFFTVTTLLYLGVRDKYVRYRSVLLSYSLFCIANLVIFSLYPLSSFIVFDIFEVEKTMGWAILWPFVQLVELFIFIGATFFAFYGIFRWVTRISWKRSLAMFVGVLLIAVPLLNMGAFYGADFLHRYVGSSTMAYGGHLKDMGITFFINHPAYVKEQPLRVMSDMIHGAISAQWIIGSLTRVSWGNMGMIIEESLTAPH